MSSQKFHALVVMSIFVILGMILIQMDYSPTLATVFYQPKTDFVKVPQLKQFESQFGSREWRAYLPEVDDLLTKIEQGVVKWPVDIKLTTDPKSSVIILPNSDNLEVGDKLSGSLQARDFYENAKTYGGDHFRARLVRLDTYGNLTDDGIAVMVQDNMNGTYDWNTIIPWHGRCKLMIELVHSSEAVAELIVRPATLVNIRRHFFAKFSDKHVVHCDILISNSTVCNYSRPELGIMWSCEKPENSSTCPEFMSVTKVKIIDRNIFGDEPLFKTFVNWKVELKNSGSVFVTKGDITDMPKSNEQCDMSTGMKRFTLGRNELPSGYYYEGKWISLLCDNKHKDLSEANRCLQHKSIYFIGDSTMRQWYLSGLFPALEVKQLPPTPNPKFYSLPRNGFSSKYDVDMHYRAHGNPLQNPGPPSSRPFVVDTLHSIPLNRSTVVVFNIGAHFFPYDPSVLMQRAAGIKNALIDLHNRLPNVKIFLRGTIRFSESYPGPLSEWLYMRTDRILRSYFSDLPYVGHIDTWEMTTVVQAINLHASGKYIDKFISLFLSYLC